MVLRTLEAVLSLCCWKGSRQCGHGVPSSGNLCVSFFSGCSAVIYSCLLLTLKLSCQNTLSLWGVCCSLCCWHPQVKIWSPEAEMLNQWIWKGTKVSDMYRDGDMSIYMWLMYCVCVYIHKCMYEHIYQVAMHIGFHPFHHFNSWVCFSPWPEKTLISYLTLTVCLL